MITRVVALGLGAMLAGCASANAPTVSPPNSVPATTIPTATASVASPGSTASPPPSGPLVEANPVDQPGAPAALYDKYWVYRGSWNSYGQAGQVGTTARIILPDEIVLGADAGLVASYAVITDDQGSEDAIVGPDGITIIVRDIRTGETVRTFETQIFPRTGLMTGSRLFWLGSPVSEDSPSRAYQPIWGIDLAEPGTEPVEIVPPGNPAYGRSPLRLSDQGRVVMSNVGGVTDPRRLTQVIDVSTMSLRTTVEGETVYAIGGEKALIVRDDDHVVVRDLGTGQRIGPPFETHETYKVFIGDGEVFLQYGNPEPARGVYLKAIDLDTGMPRDIMFQGQDVRTTYLNPELSAPGVLVLFNDDWDYGPDHIARVEISFLDPETGQLYPATVILGK